MNLKLSDLPRHLQPLAARQMRKPSSPVKPDDTGRGGCAISIPWPPSVNDLWFTTKSRKRVCTAEYEAYKRTAAIAAYAAGARSFHGVIDVTLHLHFPATNRKSDSDSRCKAVLDAMNGILWDDDSQIRDLIMRRYDGAGNPRVVILVVPGVERRESGEEER